MNNNNINATNADVQAGDQNRANQNKGPSIDNSMRPMHMVDNPTEMRQPDNQPTNMTSSMQIMPQLDNQSSVPEINATQSNEQHQQPEAHNSNLLNLPNGQANFNLPQQQQHAQQPQETIPVQLQQHQHLQQQQHPLIKPLLTDESKSDTTVDIGPIPPSNQSSPQKTFITKVKLSDELNIFDWFRTTDIINQIAEKAKSSVDSVITTLDPGMREYLYSGGNVNIVVICDSQRLVAPIRDSFQDVFGRATVVAARYNPPSSVIDYPVRTAGGFKEATQVAHEKIKKLRLDTSSIPQNQVVIVVQPAIVELQDDKSSKVDSASGWFMTYCMLIDDPVLMVTMESYSQLVPLDTDVIEGARGAHFSESFQDKQLGFPVSIDELMAAKLRLSLDEMAGDEHGCMWLPKWAGIYETQVIRQLSLTLANAYRRKWNDCASVETVS